MGFFWDLIVVFIFGLFIFIGVKNGFIKSVVGLLGSFGAMLVAGLLSRPIAIGIFDLFFKGSLTEKISSGLMNSGGAQASEKAAAVLDGLPGFLSGYVQAGDLQGQLEGAVSGAVGTATNAVVALLSPLFITFIQYIVFFVLFLAAAVAVRVFGKVLEGIFRAPVLGSANRLLGGVFGALRALILLLIAGLILFLIAPSPGKESLVSRETLNQSVLFSYFYSTKNLLVSLFGSF